MANCDYFDAAVPGTGPMALISAPNQSIEYLKYNGSYNLSLRSRSDVNLNPTPEGFLKIAGPKAEESRAGVYAVETDRGELSATAYTQINVKGQRQFQNRLQDTLRPTTKETTLYTYDAAPTSIHTQQSLYTQFIPEYTKIGSQTVRLSGATNFGLRTAAEYSYFAGAAPTGLNNAMVQNPDVAVNNLWKKPDFNVDGPGTFKGAIPDGGKFQTYSPFAKPTTNALKLNYNLETQGSELHDYSPLLGKNTHGIENRFTASYQIAPLLENPLHVIWNPENKGEVPAYYCNTNPQDFSYTNMKNLPKDNYISNEGFNNQWVSDPKKNSANAYILGIDKGIHNERIEWNQGLNNRPGVVYSPDVSLPATCYSGSRSVDDLYFNDSDLIKKSYPYADNTYTTLGDPSAGFIGTDVSINSFGVQAH